MPRMRTDTPNHASIFTAPSFVSRTDQNVTATSRRGTTRIETPPPTRTALPTPRGARRPGAPDEEGRGVLVEYARARRDPSRWCGRSGSRRPRACGTVRNRRPHRARTRPPRRRGAPVPTRVRAEAVDRSIRRLRMLRGARVVGRREDRARDDLPAEPECGGHAFVVCTAHKGKNHPTRLS